MTPPVSSAASGLSDSSRKTTSQPERPSALRSTGVVSGRWLTRCVAADLLSKSPGCE
jgi:hypothetical protein